MYDKRLPAKAELDTVWRLRRYIKGQVGLSAPITWEFCMLFIDAPIILKSNIGRLVIGQGRGGVGNPAAQ